MKSSQMTVVVKRFNCSKWNAHSTDCLLGVFWFISWAYYGSSIIFFFEMNLMNLQPNVSYFWCQPEPQCQWTQPITLWYINAIFVIYESCQWVTQFLLFLIKWKFQIMSLSANLKRKICLYRLFICLYTLINIVI